MALLFVNSGIPILSAAVKQCQSVGPITTVTCLLVLALGEEVVKDSRADEPVATEGQNLLGRFFSSRNNSGDGEKNRQELHRFDVFDVFNVSDVSDVFDVLMFRRF